MTSKVIEAELRIAHDEVRPAGGRPFGRANAELCVHAGGRETIASPSFQLAQSAIQRRSRRSSTAANYSNRCLTSGRVAPATGSVQVLAPESPLRLRPSKVR